MIADAGAVEMLLAANGIDPSEPEREALVAIYHHTHAQLQKHYAIAEARYEEPAVIFRARLNSPGISA